MPLTREYYKEFEFAKKIICHAGDIALRYFDTNIKSTLKEDQSIITEVDLAVESFLRDSFGKEFPEYGFIGEETSENNKSVAWIVDPIDGTVAFARGIPEFGVVLALKEQNEVVFSVILIPCLNNLFFAYKNQGAYKNDSEISVSTITNFDNALFSLASGNIFKKDYPEQIINLIHKYRVRLSLSAAIESSYIASGKCDVLVKFNQAIWDVAPEYLLMKEAGATIVNEYGKDLTFAIEKKTRVNYIASTNKMNHVDLKTLFKNNN